MFVFLFFYGFKKFAKVIAFLKNSKICIYKSKNLYIFGFYALIIIDFDFDFDFDKGLILNLKSNNKLYFYYYSTIIFHQ